MFYLSKSLDESIYVSCVLRLSQVEGGTAGHRCHLAAQLGTGTEAGLWAPQSGRDPQWCHGHIRMSTAATMTWVTVIIMMVIHGRYRDLMMASMS